MEQGPAMTTCDGQQPARSAGSSVEVLRYLSHPLSWLNWVETNLYFMLCPSFGFSCSQFSFRISGGGGAPDFVVVSASSSSLKATLSDLLPLCSPGRFCHLPILNIPFFSFSLLAHSFPITLIRLSLEPPELSFYTYIPPF